MDFTVISVIILALTIVTFLVVFRPSSTKPTVRSVRVVMWMSALAAIGFAADAISWVVIRPFMSGEASAIPVSFVTAVDMPDQLDTETWASIRVVHHAGSGATLLANLGEPRPFLAYGFSPVTTAALIAVPALAAALGAYLSWLAYRLARSVIEGESFTTAVIRQVNRAAIVVAVVAVVRELARLAAVNGLYSEIDEGSIVMRSLNFDFTLLLVAAGIAAFGSLLRSGLVIAKETEGLI